MRMLGRLVRPHLPRCSMRMLGRLVRPHLRRSARVSRSACGRGLWPCCTMIDCIVRCVTSRCEVDRWVAALDHPGAFSVLTLVGTRAVAPGPPDADLSDHDQAAMSRLFAHEMPDWTDREAVADFAAAGAEILGDDPVEARTVAARIWDRTPGTTPSIQMANQLGTVFSKLDCTPRWRERLPEIGVPTLVLEEAAAASLWEAAGIGHGDPAT